MSLSLLAKMPIFEYSSSRVYGARAIYTFIDWYLISLCDVFIEVNSNYLFFSENLTSASGGYRSYLAPSTLV